MEERDGISMAGPWCQQSSRLRWKSKLRGARFLGKEAVMIFFIRFSTNSTLLPCLVESGCLTLSDEANLPAFTKDMQRGKISVVVET
ncbi:hypothetical protein BJX63DRAFT_256325 [Aspergillus granulosus]|uniref:Uncharacterized protein n=1 Tax=Aspergillus granulosus TaxID=176169 RepID=A0ABR4I028_9EURO